MSETRTVHDPFTGKDVQISDRLVDRLRGKYASGPHLPNGNPEFGWKQFQAPPIQHEAAARIEALEEVISEVINSLADPYDACDFPSESAALRQTIDDALAALKEMHTVTS